MDRFTFDSLPFGQLINVQPHTKTEVRYDFNGQIVEDPIAFDELVEMHDRDRQHTMNKRYNRKARTRWSVLDPNTLLRERYVDGKLTTMTFPVTFLGGYTSPWGQKIDLDFMGGGHIRALKVDFNDGHAPKKYPSPVVFYHDKMNARSLSNPNEFVVTDRYTRDNVKPSDERDAPVPFITPTLWEKHWVTVTLFEKEPALSMMRLHVRSSLLDDVQECTSFTTGGGETISMVDRRGNVCSHGHGAVESIQVGETVFDAPIGKPVFFWYYTERGQHAINGLPPTLSELLPEAYTESKARHDNWARQLRTRIESNAYSESNPQPTELQEVTFSCHAPSVCNGYLPIVAPITANVIRNIRTDQDILEDYVDAWTEYQPPRYIDHPNGFWKWMKAGYMKDQRTPYYSWVFCDPTEDIDPPRKQPLQQQAKSAPKPPPARWAGKSETKYDSRFRSYPDKERQDKKWLRLNEPAFEERFSIYHAEVPCYRPEQHRFDEDGNDLGPAYPIIGRNENGYAIRQGLEVSDCGFYTYPVSYVRESYDFIDEQEESRYQRMLDKVNPEIDSNIADLFLYDEIEQEEYVRTLTHQTNFGTLHSTLNTSEVHMFASDVFEIGGGGSVFEKHENHSVRLDPEDADMMNVQYLKRALGVSEERAVELQAQLDVLVGADNAEKQRWIERLRGQSSDMSSEEAYRWLKECSDALLELEADTEEIQVASTSDFAQADITITVGTGADSRISMDEEMDVAIREVREMLDDGSSNPPLAPALIERYTDLQRERRELGYNANRETTIPPIKVKASDVEQTDWIMCTDNPSEDMLFVKHAQAAVRAEAAPLKAAAIRMLRINAKTRAYVWERAFENRNERAALYSACPHIRSGVKLIGAMIRHGYASDMINAIETLRDACDAHPIVGYQQLRFASQFYHVEMPETPPRTDRDWEPTAEEIHVAERDALIEQELAVNHDLDPFETAKVAFFKNAPKRDRVFKFVGRQSFAQSDRLAEIQPFEGLPASPTYAYHKIESNRAESPYTQMVVVEKKLWDFENLTRNGKPSPLWLYRIYPKWQGIDGDMVKTRRQAVQESLAWFHKDAPPPPPRLGVHNGGEEFLNGTDKPFSYRQAQWMQ